MNKMITAGVILATLGMLVPPVSATSFMIDDFVTPPAGQSVVVTGDGSASNLTTGLDGVVGGVRAMAVNVTKSDYHLWSQLVVTPTAPGTLSFSNDSGQNAVGTVTWDANGVGLGGVDLTNGGTLPYLQCAIIASDLNVGFRVDITETAAEGGATAFWTTNLGPGISYVNELLANFTNATQVNFGKVDKILLTLSGPNAQDTTLNLLEVTNTPVPEPVTMFLLGLGSLGFLGRRSLRVGGV